MVKNVGKTPSESDKCARLAISMSRTSAQLLRMPVWMKSSGDNLSGKLWMAHTASSSLTWSNQEKLIGAACVMCTGDGSFSDVTMTRIFASNRCKLVRKELAKSVTDVLVNRSIWLGVAFIRMQEFLDDLPWTSCVFSSTGQLRGDVSPSRILDQYIDMSTGLSVSLMSRPRTRPTIPTFK